MSKGCSPWKKKKKKRERLCTLETHRNVALINVAQVSGRGQEITQLRARILVFWRGGGERTRRGGELSDTNHP